MKHDPIGIDDITEMARRLMDPRVSANDTLAIDLTIDDLEDCPPEMVSKLIVLERHVQQLTMLNDTLRSQLEQNREMTERILSEHARTVRELTERLAHQRYRAWLFKTRLRAIASKRQVQEASDV